jgi:hypothetical protein
MVYKQTGSAARPRFRLVPAKPSPKKKMAEVASGSKPLLVSKPIAVPPGADSQTDNLGMSSEDPTYNTFLDFEMPQKKPKVSLLRWNSMMTELYFTLWVEAVRLHEGLA